MHSKLLTYFEAIARHGSIRKAADALNVAPSAVNRHLLELEALMGTALFDRLPRGVRLNAAGEILVHHARATLRDFHRAQSEIEQLRTGMRGRLTVVSIESALTDILPEAIRLFTERFPRIEIEVLGRPYGEAVQAVSDGVADVAILFNTPPNLPLVNVAAADFPLGIIVSPEHPLAVKKTAVLSDLIGHQIIMPDPSITIFDQVEHVLASSAVRLKPQITSNSMAFMTNYVELGGAAGLATPIGIGRKLRGGTLRFIPLQDRGIPVQRLVGAVSDAAMPVAVANFCQHLKAFMPSWYLTLD